MNFFPNETGYQPRVMLIGGASEIGLAILAALALPPNAEIILAGRDEQRLAAAGKELPGQVRTVGYDATQTASHQAFVDGVFADGPVDLVISAAGVLVPHAGPHHDAPGGRRRGPRRRAAPWPGRRMGPARPGRPGLWAPSCPEAAMAPSFPLGGRGTRPDGPYFALGGRGTRPDGQHLALGGRGTRPDG